MGSILHPSPALVRKDRVCGVQFSSTNIYWNVVDGNSAAKLTNQNIHEMNCSGKLSLLRN